jgi:hypothetical protein
MDGSHAPYAASETAQNTLWVNGVKMTPKLWKRLHAMSDNEYEEFWHEQLKGMQWAANGKPPTELETQVRFTTIKQDSVKKLHAPSELWLPASVGF